MVKRSLKGGKINLQREISNSKGRGDRKRQHDNTWGDDSNLDSSSSGTRVHGAGETGEATKVKHGNKTRVGTVWFEPN